MGLLEIIRDWWNDNPDDYEEQLRRARHYVIISITCSVINIYIIAHHLLNH